MTDSHSRRDALKLLGAGAAAFSCAVVGGEGPGTQDGRHRAPAGRYFPLSRVRLGPGPFLDAQRLDGEYLLRLEPDRMLHNFRVNAGLEPKAPVYGGWESVEPWIEIRCHGHTLGQEVDGEGDRRWRSPERCRAGSASAPGEAGAVCCRDAVELNSDRHPTRPARAVRR